MQTFITTWESLTHEVSDNQQFELCWLCRWVQKSYLLGRNIDVGNTSIFTQYWYMGNHINWRDITSYDNQPAQTCLQNHVRIPDILAITATTNNQWEVEAVQNLVLQNYLHVDDHCPNFWTDLKPPWKRAVLECKQSSTSSLVFHISFQGKESKLLPELCPGL